MSTKWPPDVARLINNCIIIYNNNSGINSSIFGHRCEQWGQINNSETGKSVIILIEYNQPDPKESHPFSPI